MSKPSYSEELQRAGSAALAQLAEYVEASQRGEGPAIANPPLGDVMADLDLRRRLREGGMDAEDFGAFLAEYLARTTRLHHPGALAHQVAVPDAPAALGDLVHGVINNPMAIYEMGAAAATIEVAILEWMIEKLGWDVRRAGGVLTHGGSLANLTALLAARARTAPDAWTRGVGGDLALLAPPSAHYSIKRAAGILGLGEDAVVALETDELERIRPDRLGDALKRTRAAGRRPIALVAAACATSTGLHDDLVAIGEFCREHGVWFHVDAAHGASALLSEDHRGLLAGIEQADSTVWDAHKMLRTSSLAAAVLGRRGGVVVLSIARDRDASVLAAGHGSLLPCRYGESPTHRSAASAVRQRGSCEEEEPDLEGQHARDRADHHDPLDPADPVLALHLLLALVPHAAQPRRGLAGGGRPSGELVVLRVQPGEDEREHEDGRGEDDDHGKDGRHREVVEIALDLRADPDGEQRCSRPQVDRADGGGRDDADLLQRHRSRTLRPSP